LASSEKLRRLLDESRAKQQQSERYQLDSAPMARWHACVLDGANAYSGGTTVTGATLVVNGSIGDPTINAGGVLTGTGSIGSTQINAGGTFAPGNGTPGTSMTVQGNLALQSGAI
jgi:hypothetical protein